MKPSEKQKLHKRLKSFCGMMGEALHDLDATLVSRLEDTIESLGKPHKVVIAGLTGSQHRGVGEIFAGDKLFASAEEAKSCPTIELGYGKKPQTMALFGDAQKIYPELSLSVALAGKTPDAIRILLPHPMLAEIDLTILPAYDGDDNRAGYLVRLLNDTEVIVWCSDAATPWAPQERRLWFTVPDTLKERSVLALTNPEGLTTDAAKEALEQKLEFVQGDFGTSAQVFVDDAKSSVQRGGIADAAVFASSGGQALLEQVMSYVQAGQHDMLAEARALRTEIDTIPIGGAAPVPSAPLEPLTASAPTPQAEAPIDETPAQQANRILLSGTKKCQTALSSCEAKNYSPLFESLNDLLVDLSKVMASDLMLTSDHDLMVKQVAEASELVGLLTYENNEKAAFEAADILRQIAIDISTRLPSNSEDRKQNISVSDQVSSNG